MSEQNQTQEEEFEVIIEGEEPKEEPKTKNSSEENDDDGDEGTSSEENDEGTSSEENDDGDTDEEREAIRERRRQERARKKHAQREREDSFRRELSARDAKLQEMQNKLDAIERRNSGSELAQLENAKKQVAASYAYHKDQIRIASENGNHALVAEATDKMMQSQRKFDELNNIERVYKQRQQAPAPLDPRLVSNANSWTERNKWYDPAARDQDSRIVRTIDDRLVEEGWDPTSQEYWDELDARIKKYLPHRVSGGKVTSTKPKSVVAGSGRDSSSAGSSGKQTYKLSKERVDAMKEAGVWDDPKKRADMIRRYREADKQQRDNG